MKIKDGQKFALIKLCQKFVKGRTARLWIISQLVGRKIATSDDLTISDWQSIRNRAYPNWPNDDWEISEEFYNVCYQLKNRFEKEVLGQMALFGKEK